MTPRRIRAELASGALVRLRPGVYASGSKWKASTPGQQVIARARALALISTTPPLFSHETAAALQGLPLYKPDRSRVHVIAPIGRPGRATGVIRHRGDVPADELEEIDGMLCTGLERTAADCARTQSFEASVTIADAALRRVAFTGAASYDLAAAERFRAAALTIAQRSAHGQTRAQRTLRFADGRAQLPGESLSRVRLHELGFREIRLQVRVPGPGGRNFYVDFGIEEAQAFGEFDGAMKYVDGRLTDGRTASQVVDDEKQREDWIRGTTQRRLVRWGWPHIADAEGLGRRLTAFGIDPPA
jgi:hypothetical protein